LPNINPAINLQTKLAYGAGDCALAFIVFSMQLYLLYFYTDVLGISASAAGTIFLIAVIFDALSDPIMGILLQKSKSKGGRYRQYIIWGGALLAFFNVSLYWAPSNVDLFLYALFTHLSFRAVFTMASIPFYALIASITQDSKARSTLAGCSMVGAAIGAVLVAMSFLSLVEYLGQGDMQQGFLYTSTLFSALAFLLLLLTFFATSENEQAPLDHKVSLKQIWRTWKNNPPFVQISFGMIFAFTGTTMFVQGLVYYAKYYLNAEDAITTLLTTYVGITALITPVWMLLLRKINKKTLWFIGAGLFISAALLLWLLSFNNLKALLLLLVVNSCGTSAISLAYWSMLPDTIEYGQAKTGHRVESFTYGVAALGLKLNYSFAVGIIGMVLGYTGFTANEEQSKSTTEGIQALVSWIPAILVLSSAILVAKYPINSLLHRSFVRASDPN
jgi:GPH family glycoside/pentoside/hexuronide:cation symporter